MDGFILATMGKNELAVLRENGCKSDQLDILDGWFEEVIEFCKTAATKTLDDKADLMSRFDTAIDLLEKDCPTHVASIQSLRNIVDAMRMTKCGGP